MEKKTLAVIVGLLIIIGTASYYVYQETTFSTPSAPSFIEDESHAFLDNPDGEIELRFEETKTGGKPIESYNLYKGNSSEDISRYDNSERENKVAFLTAGTKVRIQDTNVYPGETYYYRISAVNEEGEGKLSDTIEIKVQTGPRDFTASAQNDGIILNWTEPFYDEDDVYVGEYRIECEGNDSFYNSVDNLTSERTRYIVNGTENDTEYTCRVGVKLYYVNDPSPEPLWYPTYWTEEITVEA